MNHTTMELKVCEGCGVLWLRARCLPTAPAPAAPRSNVYCKRCVRLLADFPAPSGPRKNSRIRVRVRTRKPLALAAPQAGAR